LRREEGSTCFLESRTVHMLAVERDGASLDGGGDPGTPPDKKALPLTRASRQGLG
jgi:hypothetical protein